MHAFGQNMYFFSLFLFVKIRLQIMFKNVLDRKEAFFSHKKFNLSTGPKFDFFQRV